MKLTFKNMISALLEDTALTVPCTLLYGVTKTTQCENCIYDGIGKKSSNRYKDGGPIPFINGQMCPLCQGDGVKQIQTSEDGVYLAVIWNYKDFIHIDRKVAESPDGFVQTLSLATTTYKIKAAQEIIFNTDLEESVRHKFKRHGEPTPLGYGEDAFILTYWKKV